ncbi:hypothetical protein [Mariprofundus sp. KV]|uniref:hypothetical protein n=1 Tax=Mariprofundus sp. KV TaxID=2608715 RepID=UPI0015A26869|nr:hypothetical protein [Mariprofundus sp. KV]
MKTDQATDLQETNLQSWDTPVMIRLDGSETHGKPYVDATESHRFLSTGGGASYGPS